MGMSFLAGVAGELAGGAALTPIKQALDPLILASSYKFWGNIPCKLPDVNAVINAYNRGFLTDAQANFICSRNGANFKGGEIKRGTELDDKGGFANAWESIGKATRYFPDAETVIQSYLRGILKDEDFTKQLVKAAASYRDWDKVYDSFRMWLPPGTLQDSRNRELITAEEYRDQCRKYGGYTDQQLDQLDKLREQFPGISDLIRFVVRDIYDPQIVADQGLFDGSQSLDAVEKYMRWNGYYGPTGVQNPARGREATWTDIYWAAHWQPISPTQAYEIFHRVREDNVAKHRALGFDVQTFTIDSVRQWLKIADYPPKIRDYLAAISYRMLTRVDVRRMFNEDVLTKPEVVSAYRDLGYDEQNAKRLADFAEKLKTKQGKGKDTEPLRREIYRGYDIGMIARQDAFNNAVASYGQGNCEAECQRLVNIQLDRIDLRHSVDLVRRAVSALRSDFLEGALTLDQADQQLIAMGITDVRRQQYLRNWQIDFTRARKVASASKVIEWYKKGLITGQDAYNRFRNLGWSEPDIMLWLSSADYDLAKARYALEQRQARTAEQKARAAHAAADHARTHHQWAIGELKSHSSPAQLCKWLKLDLIDEGTFRQRLRNMDWPDDDIERLWQQCQKPLPEESTNGTGANI